MNKDLILAADELDTIGEIMNISMGAAATAVSTMLERQVVITTPNITQDRFGNIDMSELEPAIVVKINYVEGISGMNLIMLRRNDMRIILDLLMGNDGDDDNFEFDEMSMSAACEVMNQMMGASATALSELLNKPINISSLPGGNLTGGSRLFLGGGRRRQRSGDILQNDYKGDTGHYLYFHYAGRPHERHRVVTKRRD